MLHFFTAVFFALLVTLLRGPGNPLEMLAVFVVAWLFMACLVELIRHHVRLVAPEPMREVKQKFKTQPYKQDPGEWPSAS